MLVLSLLLAKLSIQYSINYFDCNNITDMKTYKQEKICSMEPKNNTTTTQFTILQKQDIQETTGFSCQIIRSTMTEYCGAYSHNKLAKVPEVEINEVVTVEKCHHLVSTQSFTTKEGKASIKIDEENLITSYDLGVIQVKENSISCRGQPARFGSNIVNDILQVSQWKIIVKKEKFLVDHIKQQVEVSADHLLLPCSTEARGCEVAEKTYIWQLAEDRCPLAKIRTAMMREDHGYLMDETHKILLKKGTPVPSPQGCPTATIHHTEYPNIYLSESTATWHHLNGAELDLPVHIASRDDYLSFKLEEKINWEDNLLQAQVCKNSLNLNHEIIPLTKKGTFMKQNGDTYLVFRCQEKIGTLKPMATCFDDIPIEGGFVKTNRVFTAHSAPKPCNQYFGLKILTLDKGWVELKPHIHPTAEPEDLPTTLTKFEHEDLSEGGLYTQEELQAWTKHLEQGDIHTAIMKSITYGVCQARGSCEANPDVPTYDLTNLEGIITAVGMWSSLEKWIQRWGTWISLTVILVELLHLIVWIVAIIYTITYDGLVGLQAWAYLMCCQPMNTSNTVNRRHHRINNRNKEKRQGKRKTETGSTSYVEMEMGDGNHSEGSYLQPNRI